MEFDRGAKVRSDPSVDVVASTAGPAIARDELQREMAPGRRSITLDPPLDPKHPLYQQSAHPERYEGLPIRPSPLPNSQPTLRDMIVQRERDEERFTRAVQSGEIKGFPPEVVAAGERSINALVRRCLNEPEFQRRLLQEGPRAEEPQREVNPRRPSNVVMSMGVSDPVSGIPNVLAGEINRANQARYGANTPVTGVVKLGDNSYSVNIPLMGLTDLRLNLRGLQTSTESPPTLAGGITKPEPGRPVFGQAMSQLVTNVEQWSSQNQNRIERAGTRRDGLISEWELKGANAEAKEQVKILDKMLKDRAPGEVVIRPSDDLPDVFKRKLQEMGLSSERPIRTEELSQLRDNLSRFSKLADNLLANDPHGGGSRFQTLASMKMENPLVSTPQLRAPGLTSEGQILRHPSSLFGERKNDLLEAIDRNSPTVRDVIRFADRELR